MTARIYVGLGSNISPRVTYLKKAVKGIEALGVAIDAVSSLYRTSPVGNENQNFFLNAVLSGATSLPAEAVMEGLLSVEKSLGRIRGERWGPRTIDLDLLLYDRIEMESARLILPHPRMTERKFVLVPLLELAPDLVSPRGERYAGFLSRIGGAQKIRFYRKCWT